MKRKGSMPAQLAPMERLLGELRTLISSARQQALRAVDLVQMRTCWEVGRHIVEFEQGGAARAEYGARLLPHLAERLTTEFGKGFDERNLWYMCSFYRAFPILNALRSELSWTHYRSLLRVEDGQAREWYMNEAASQNWGTRALDRQIGTLYYERLLASKDRKPVQAEAAKKTAAADVSPREFVRDPVMLEFLGLPGTGRLLESKLFASKYRLILPSEDELRAELDRERQRMLEAVSEDVASRKTSGRITGRTRKPRKRA